ncbi:hypothetical protein LN040_14410 [Desulfovibrio subterraneus]|jgi:pyruvate,water dikinase|uniref:PEP/pyruvate-binding domain-containing protein n=1 Tax=Desulfovibrio subterraneus TaxID=2718620 RepID=UPI0022B8AAB4|nr:PEP/pyruvate-binding domain-containing protein [Desulfovibrio subterraneus]WBF66900.1 hypothetical protein LN040_14410 [Desulfovibrio subterraneus]
MTSPDSALARAWAVIATTARRLSGSAPYSSAEEESLRASFREACGRFKRLISANNKALEAMSHMEQALEGTAPYDLSYVRTQSTRIVSSVYQMIEAMETIAPGRYGALRERFEAIRAEISPHLETTPEPADGPLVLPFSSLGCEHAPQVGGKAANLGELRNKANLPVPDGFAVTAHGFWAFMRHSGLDEEADRQLRLADPDRLDNLYAMCSRIQQQIMRSPLPDELVQALTRAEAELRERTGYTGNLAVRSSALGEDMPGQAFAGQYRSLLNVPSETLAEAWREVAASKYGAEAVAYRLRCGLSDRDTAVSVAVMPMLGSVAGGVLYTRDPVDVRSEAIIIHAVQGLPRGVVDGRLPTDRFAVQRTAPFAIVERHVAFKKERYVTAPGEGVAKVDSPPEEAALPSLTDEQLQQLAALAERVEQHYGTPQDVEWAMLPDTSFMLLQSRPLTMPSADAIARRLTPPTLPEGTVVLVQGGETASPGTGAGPIVQIRKQAEALAFPEGGVLVVPYAAPRWAPLLSRASAVIAGTGSSAGHLANVAREFGVPALFGTGWKADSLETGTLVTVDADAGLVLEGRVESLLTAPKPRNVMQGTSVHATLKQVLSHIAPLSLTDPDCPDFRAVNCKTMHDITRFCHQKAVEEMFRDGKDARFPKHLARQLYHGRPLQFWVVDLDDAFRSPPAGKLIPLENIASPPMHALWHGMMHIPWQGPPPVHARGFLSVLAESALDPGFEPSSASIYSMKNYFLVSSRFCTLQSRFGYHFCTVETLAGDVDAENFAAFRFKGGAADADRRLMRVRLIADILEENNFRVQVIRDSLAARMEGLPLEHMLRALQVLGYLAMHTRQLDMVMSSPEAVQHYRDKIATELQEVLGSHTTF